MNKILIISYHFPPAAGAAVQRMLKFIKFLPEFGWQPYVLTVDKVDYPDMDESLLNEIPPGVKVTRTKYNNPLNLYRKFTGKSKTDKIPVGKINRYSSSFKERIAAFIRLNFFIPDAKIGWIPYGVKEGIKLINEENIDIILSSGPPHTCHIIARNIKRKTGIKWVADFRDPWTDIDYYSGLKRSKIAEKIDASMELSVLSEADHIISASEGYLNILKSKGAENNYDVITNGFDTDDFIEIKRKYPEKFIVTYTGNMPLNRSPYNLWLVLNELILSNPEFRNDFIFKFAGVIDRDADNQIKQFTPFSEHFEKLGYISHRQAIELVFNSALLILVVNNVKTSNEILPGKIFEYIATGNPVLVIGPEDGQSGKVIKEVNHGTVIDYDKKDELKNYIYTIYTKWKNKELNPLINPSAYKYQRRDITGKLSEIFNSLF